MTRLVKGHALSRGVPEWCTSVRVAGSFAQRPACTWELSSPVRLTFLPYRGV